MIVIQNREKQGMDFDSTRQYSCLFFCSFQRVPNSHKLYNYRWEEIMLNVQSFGGYKKVREIRDFTDQQKQSQM